MKSKNIFNILIIIPLLMISLTSCDKDLPYPLDDVKHGAAIDIYKLDGTSANVKVDPIGVNIGVKLQVLPKAEGEFASIQLACCYLNKAKNEEKYFVVQDNITTLPQDIVIDYNALIAKVSSLGYKLAVGDQFYFTTNVVLSNNTIVPGYNIYTGYFNNNAFAAYLIPKADGSGNRNYSRYVLYNVQ